MSGEGTAASVAGEVLRRARESNGCPRATLGLPARGGGAAAGRGGGRATTTPAAARAAFRRMALALHPDKAKGAPGAEEAFKVANTALGRLLRELQRDEWDAARVARAAAGAEAGDRAAGGGGGGGVSEAAVQAARGAWGGGVPPGRDRRRQPRLHRAGGRRRRQGRREARRDGAGQCSQGSQATRPLFLSPFPVVRTMMTFIGGHREGLRREVPARTREGAQRLKAPSKTGFPQGSRLEIGA